VRFSDFFICTSKEAPSDADIPSNALSLRASLIRKIASGIYTFMPLGLIVLRKIENIVREEMNKAGAIELLMPAVQPADLWKKSNRWEEYGPEMFRFKDRNQREFCLGPTHEELITYLAFLDIKSYKDLPINLYQIQVKFRDEIRPRYGILRAREFIMKDAYSFSETEEDLDRIYLEMYKAYENILKRLNLKYRVIEAESGLIGGNVSNEFIILAENGEDTLVYCDKCKYAANYEIASYSIKNKDQEKEKKKKIVHTPDVKDIKTLEDFLSISSKKIIKTMVLKDKKGNLAAVLLRGDKELNIEKTKKHLGADYDLLGDDDIKGLNIGFVGPSGLDTSIKIISDRSIEGIKNAVAGANKKDYHMVNVNYPRDFDPGTFGEFSYPSQGDLCPKCNGRLVFEKGIEMGHIFKLGKKYSVKLDARFLDKDGKLKPFIMGCYGIGISRILAAAIEQSNDEKGIIWPISITPFIANIILTNTTDDELKNIADKIYKDLLNNGIEVAYDDRETRAGIKFKDSDLIGIPLKIIVGKKYKEEKKIELEYRKTGEKKEVSEEQIRSLIKELK